MSAKLKREKDMHLWLARIIDDLDPEDFSATELIAEFGAADGSMSGSTDNYNGERYIRNRIALLLDNSFVEKIAKGRYRVTENGKNFRDEREVYYD